MLLFNGVVFLYLGLSFLAPVLLKIGVERPARLLYQGYSLTCHQLAYRSWFLFGEQPFYPRRVANVAGFKSYEDVVKGNVNDIWSAKSYLGDQHLGFKVALCERDVALYGGILAFGLLFSLTGRRLPAISWWMWIILGILPIAWDGGSQIISQLPIKFIQNIFPMRESTPILRSITGALFGIATAWFAYPLVEMSMQDSIRILNVKYKSNNSFSKDINPL